MATLTSGSIVLRSQDAITANEPPSTSELVGLDSATLTETWHVKFPARQCGFAALPVATNGAIVCYGKDMVVFRPSSDIATPVATPVATLAESENPPIMQGGTAAQDLNYPGSIPGPDAATTLLWEDSLDPNAPMNASILAHIFGEVVIQIDSYGLHEILLARSLQTGEDLWSQQDLECEFGYAITSAGVVVGIPEDPDSIGTPRAYAIALLDLHTGEQLWQTEYKYVNGTRNIGPVLVSGQSIYFVDDPMTVVAVDLSTGVERWRFDAAQGRTEAEMVENAPPGSRLWRPGVPQSATGDQRRCSLPVCPNPGRSDFPRGDRWPAQLGCERDRAHRPVLGGGILAGYG